MYNYWVYLISLSDMSPPGSSPQTFPPREFPHGQYVTNSVGNSLYSNHYCHISDDWQTYTDLNNIQINRRGSDRGVGGGMSQGENVPWGIVIY